MKNKLLHKFYSVVFAIVFLLPFVIQSVHAVNHEQHTFCDAQEIKHIHKKQADCGIYHISINKNSITFSSDYSVTSYKLPVYQDITYYNTKYVIDLKTKSSRAPPF